MPLQFLSDNRLYTDYEYCMAHFYGEEPRRQFPQALIYHGYWAGALTQHHELCLKSLLVTQSPPYQVWIWMLPFDIRRNLAFIARFKDVTCLHWKVYRPDVEAKGTPLQGHPTPGKPITPLDLANVLRLVALWKYGGVYFDLDVLFLRALRPLCHVDFAYQWSNQPYGNNAVFYGAKGSQDMWRLMERGAAIDRCNPRYLLDFAEMQQTVDKLTIWPVFIFDPVWLAHDTRVPINAYCNHPSDFFSNETPITLAQFFPGAYTYHWHNMWDIRIRRPTLVGQLFSEIDAKFKATSFSQV